MLHDRRRIRPRARRDGRGDPRCRSSCTSARVCQAADEERTFRDRLAADGVAIVGEWDEPDYVSVKFRDPDGYVVDVSWEPR